MPKMTGKGAPGATKRVFVDVHETSEFGADAPSVAYFDLHEDFVARLGRLDEVLRREQLTEVRFNDRPDGWAGYGDAWRDDINIAISEASVTNGAFQWIVSPSHVFYQIETRLIGLKELREILASDCAVAYCGADVDALEKEVLEHSGYALRMAPATSRPRG